MACTPAHCQPLLKYPQAWCIIGAAYRRQKDETVNWIALQSVL